MSRNNQTITGLSPEQEQSLAHELSLLDLIQDAIDQPGTVTDPMEITDHGQIDRMVIPAGWVEVEPEDTQGIGTRSSRVFKPINDESARLCLFYRGLPIDIDAGAAFSAILARGPHELDQEEIHAVGEVLGSKAIPEHFKIDFCRVESFKDRTVLTIKGKYRTTGERVLEIFVDADGSGRFIQQVYYQAPKNVYAAFERGARAAFKSLQWRAR